MYQCAKVASPTGGDKDTIPPVIRRSLPENNSAMFNGKQIEVLFNEFVQLKGISNTLIVSPPMQEQPDIRLRGKSMIITIKDTLRENTTYTFNFGDAVCDLNEGNPIQNFEFVFSTGSTVDSLAIAGKVLNALSLETIEGVYVMLYDQLNDSAPISSKPLYVSRTNKQGDFRIGHLKEGVYKLFALKDGNANYRYDLSSEEIAFIDKPVTISHSLLSPVDSMEMIRLMSDSSKAGDSLLAERNIVSRYSLHLFKETEQRKLYLVKKERLSRNEIFLVFSKPPVGEVLVNPVDSSLNREWCVAEISRRSDTLHYWITDSSLYSQENLSLVLKYQVEDSLNKQVLFADTVRLRYVEPAKTRRGRTTVVEVAKSLALASSITQGAVIDLDKAIRLGFATPVVRVDTTRIHLEMLQDSVWIGQEYIFKRDSFSLRNFHVYHPWKPESMYHLFIEPGAFTDFSSLANDTVDVRFSARSTEYYGTIFLEVNNITSPVLIQMLNEKNDPVRQTLLTEDTRLVYNYLPPVKVRFRAIYDRNKNRMWDTGSYLAGQQPEKVLYLGPPTEVRSNWEIELTWSLSEEK